MYYYGARYYDAKSSVWQSVDPKLDKYPGWSPYNYALNNPIIVTDPAGDTVRVYTETSGAGHAWISVGEGDDMTVYTYGRYAGTNEKWHGINTLSNGPGVLVKLEGKDAQSYNQSKTEKTGVMVFNVLDVSDEEVGKILEAKFNSSSTLPAKGEFKGDPRARVIEDYQLLSNNCTTTVSDALNTAGSKALESMPNGKTGMTNRNRFIVPVSLESFLEWQSSSWLGNNSTEISKQSKSN